MCVGIHGALFENHLFSRRNTGFPHLALDAGDNRLGVIEATVLDKPARAFGHRLTRDAHDDGRHADDREHQTPRFLPKRAPYGDEEQAQEHADGRPAVCDGRADGAPTAAARDRRELVDHAEAGHQLRPQTKAHEEAHGYHERHVRGKRAQDGGEAEQQQVELERLAPAELVADKAGDQRADEQAQKACRQKRGGLLVSGEPGFGQRALHASRQVNVHGIHEHAGRGQRHHLLERRRRLRGVHATHELRGAIDAFARLPA